MTFYHEAQTQFAFDSHSSPCSLIKWSYKESGSCWVWQSTFPPFCLKYFCLRLRWADIFIQQSLSTLSNFPSLLQYLSLIVCRGDNNLKPFHQPLNLEACHSSFYTAFHTVTACGCAVCTFIFCLWLWFSIFGCVFLVVFYCGWLCFFVHI